MYTPVKTSAGIYIHIPFCHKKCGYCSFVSFENSEDYISDYVKALIREIRNSKYDNRSVDTIFFGGGTPSLLKSQDLYNIMECIHDTFDVTKNAEITTEANPGTMNMTKLKDYLECGINRISFGVQSLDDNDLKYLGRIHDRKEALQVLKDAVIAGYENINMDLIYGLPERNPDIWKRVLDEALSLDISHLSMYALTLDDDTPLGKSIKLGKNAELSDDVAADEYELIDKRNHRFLQYEISNYSLPGYECRHNLKYWKREDYYGFGVAAHSSVGRNRFSNTTDLKSYIDNINNDKSPEVFREELSDEEILGETIMLALRTRNGVKYDDIRRVFNVEFEDRYRNEIIELLSDELIDKTEVGIKLSKRGRLLGNQVFMRFIN